MGALIVEDEDRLARNIASVLREAASFAVDITADGEDGLHLARTNQGGRVPAEQIGRLFDRF